MFRKQCLDMTAGREMLLVAGTVITVTDSTDSRTI